MARLYNTTYVPDSLWQEANINNKGKVNSENQNQNQNQNKPTATVIKLGQQDLRPTWKMLGPQLAQQGDCRVANNWKSLGCPVISDDQKASGNRLWGCSTSHL